MTKQSKKVDTATKQAKNAKNAKYSAMLRTGCNATDVHDLYGYRSSLWGDAVRRADHMGRVLHYYRAKGGAVRLHALTVKQAQKQGLAGHTNSTYKHKDPVVVAAKALPGGAPLMIEDMRDAA